jgi:hypothetical protein
MSGTLATILSWASCVRCRQDTGSALPNPSDPGRWQSRSAIAAVIARLPRKSRPETTLNNSGDGDYQRADGSSAAVTDLLKWGQLVMC